MLYRLVRPMARKGSSKQQFVKRIPADVRAALVGRMLAIPLSDDCIQVAVTEKMQAIRFSLRTSDPVEVKIRQAEASVYLERVFESLRANHPMTLNHRQAVALSGELYRAWENALNTSETISVVHTKD